MPKFTLRGQMFDLDKGEIERALRNLQPEAVTKHAVQVNGKMYPVKQALRAALGKSDISRLDFTSADARRILRRLEFRLFEEGPGNSRRK